jgi:hypothetical protein
MLRIGNAQAFWGDRPTAPASLVQQQPDLDYLTLDYLAEVSLSIMAIQREKDPTAGYAKDFLDVLKSLIPFWQQGRQVKIVTNAGGLNPIGCAKACQEILSAENCFLKIAIVNGDDVLSILQSQKDDRLFANLETQEPLSNIRERLVTANAYLGAKSIAEALLAGAQIVITGRVTDPSLTVGPCVAHYGWSWQEYDKLAGATVAGHVIECGTQATGGICTNWLDVPDIAHIGFPVVEIEESGNFVITKPPGTGGKVTIETVKEQLIYELGDPENYLSPDVVVSFLGLQLKELESNRIFVQGAKGKASPNTMKVSATYKDGFKTEAMLAFYGRDVIKKARRCGEIVLERLNQQGFEVKKHVIECLGAGGLVPGIAAEPLHAKECILRIAIADHRKEALECFAKEIAGLVTSGPQGVTGYTTGRPRIRPVFGYWPCLIEKNQVHSTFHLINGNL